MYRFRLISIAIFVVLIGVGGATFMNGASQLRQAEQKESVAHEYHWEVMESMLAESRQLSSSGSLTRSIGTGVFLLGAASLVATLMWRRTLSEETATDTVAEPAKDGLPPSRDPLDDPVQDFSRSTTPLNERHRWIAVGREVRWIWRRKSDIRIALFWVVAFLTTFVLSVFLVAINDLGDPPDSWAVAGFVCASIMFGLLLGSLAALFIPVGGDEMFEPDSESDRFNAYPYLICLSASFIAIFLTLIVGLEIAETFTDLR